MANGPSDEVPKAYLNYVIYDQDYQVVHQGFRQVSKAAAVGKANPDNSAETLTLDVAIEQDGYLLTYLSHEAGSGGSSSPSARTTMASSSTSTTGGRRSCVL